MNNMVIHYSVTNSMQNEGSAVAVTGTIKSRSQARRAFTLIELLVVIAIIAILAAILLPVLEKAEERAQEIQCVNDLRQLMIAWHMYADDNREYAPNEDYDNAYPRWVCGDMRGQTTPAKPGAIAYPGIDATNTLLLVDPDYSVMGPYIKNPKIFKCPADLSTWSTINSPGNSEQPRVRSYSMSQAVGPCENGTLVGQDVMGHWLTGPGTSGNGAAPGGSPWNVFIKDSQIVGMSPSDLFVLCEEHPNSINDAALAVDMPQNVGKTEFIDTPSKLHINSGAFSFADCHAEIHKWLNPGGIGNVFYQVDSRNAPNLGGVQQISANNPDVIWLCHHTTCLAPGVNGKTIFQP